MEIVLTLQYTPSIVQMQLGDIVDVFKANLPRLVGSFVSQVVSAAAEALVKGGDGERFRLPRVRCRHCGGHGFAFKSHGDGGPMKHLTTVFGDIEVPNIQIYCKACGARKRVTGLLLDVPPDARADEATGNQLALAGALTSFRNTQTIGGIFGSALDKATFWRYAQKAGGRVTFKVDPDEPPVLEADGTGIPTHGDGKRGSELKVLVQKCSDRTAEASGSRYRVAGLSVGGYIGGWDGLFGPSIKVLREMEVVYLTIDGEAEVLKALGNVNVKVQRCLWHIPHQAKYTLWEDKADKDGPEYRHVMAGVYEAVSTAYVPDEELRLLLALMRKEEVQTLIGYCDGHGMPKTAAYLRNAQYDLLTCVYNKMAGRTTSIVERVMRTVNMRVNVGKWSRKGALNINKIRLGFYYNGFLNYLRVS